MLLTLFLAIVTCAAITIMMFAAVAFIQDKKMFSAAPKEFREVIKPRDNGTDSEMSKEIITSRSAKR